jgi:hypothetical protein
MSDDREVFKVRRDAGLAKRQETREDRFHERVREVLAEGLVGTYSRGGRGSMYVTPRYAELLAAAAYQALLDAGYVVIPATEETT